jgi:putative membrane protein
MFIQKNFGIRGIMAFSGMHLIWITLWVSLVALLYELTQWEWLSIPWLPLSVIGTAVAFYIGFKNNQAYDRLWEARKIWGAIVNSSRAFGSTIRAYITNDFAANPLAERELKGIHQKLIYRHIAWLYSLRSQLLIPTPWEHISQNRHIARTARRRIKHFGVGLLDDDITSKNLKKLLSTAEYERLINFKNTATQIIDLQSQDLRVLKQQGLIDDFRHMELQKILNDFYIHQGKAERIKKFPLPRQYGNMSFIFVGIFIFLLPFGMVSEFAELGDFGVWLSIPFSVLVCWIFLMMELVGDYSENPFEGMGNDIPMYALTRTIEIDLREMLGEKDLPPGVEAVNGVLM